MHNSLAGGGGVMQKTRRFGRAMNGSGHDGVCCCGCPEAQQRGLTRGGVAQDRVGYTLGGTFHDKAVLFCIKPTGGYTT